MLASADPHYLLPPPPPRPSFANRIRIKTEYVELKTRFYQLSNQRDALAQELGEKEAKEAKLRMECDLIVEQLEMIRVRLPIDARSGCSSDEPAVRRLRKYQEPSEGFLYESDDERLVQAHDSAGGSDEEEEEEQGQEPADEEEDLQVDGDAEEEEEEEEEAEEAEEEEEEENSEGDGDDEPEDAESYQDAFQTHPIQPAVHYPQAHPHDHQAQQSPEGDEEAEEEEEEEEEENEEAEEEEVEGEEDQAEPQAIGRSLPPNHPLSHLPSQVAYPADPQYS